MNMIHLVGKMTHPPKISVDTEGKRIAKFMVTTLEDNLESDGQNRKVPVQHKVVTWGNPVYVLENIIQPGANVFIDGKLMNTMVTTKTGEQYMKSRIEALELGLA